MGWRAASGTSVGARRTFSSDASMPSLERTRCRPRSARKLRRRIPARIAARRECDDGRVVVDRRMPADQCCGAGRLALEQIPQRGLQRPWVNPERVHADVVAAPEVIHSSAARTRRRHVHRPWPSTAPSGFGGCTPRTTCVMSLTGRPIRTPLQLEAFGAPPHLPPTGRDAGRGGGPARPAHDDVPQAFGNRRRPPHRVTPAGRSRRCASPHPGLIVRPRSDDRLRGRVAPGDGGVPAGLAPARGPCGLGRSIRTASRIAPARTRSPSRPRRAGQAGTSGPGRCRWSASRGAGSARIGRRALTCTHRSASPSDLPLTVTSDRRGGRESCTPCGRCSGMAIDTGAGPPGGVRLRGTGAGPTASLGAAST